MKKGEIANFKFLKSALKKLYRAESCSTGLYSPDKSHFFANVNPTLLYSSSCLQYVQRLSEIQTNPDFRHSL